MKTLKSFFIILFLLNFNLAFAASSENFSDYKLPYQTITSLIDKGEFEISIPENLTTWIFEDGTFIPQAKLQGDKSYSIITDHLGTPTEAYNEEGQKVWSRELGIYGQTRKETGVKNFVPYLYQGQYLDVETELAYNRFRYYSPESGTYVSQDPIRLDGGMPNAYSYVADSNTWIDVFGLSPIGSWNEFLQATKGTFTKAGNFAGDGNVMKDAAEAWKQYQNSVNTSDLPAIGRLPQTQPLTGKPGINILNSSRWNLNVNDAWLRGAIDSGKNVHLVTNPIRKNLWDFTNNRWAVLKRELDMLKAAGYKRKGKMMIHPNNISC